MSRRSFDLKMSRQLYSNHEDSEELPKQWDILSHRVTNLEREITLLHKRYSKLGKKFNQHAQQTTQMNLQLAEQLTTIRNQGTNKQNNRQQISQAIARFKMQIQEQIDFKINKVLINKVNQNNMQVNQTIEQKTRAVYEQSKNYIDKIAYQLQQIIRKYPKEHNGFQKKVSTKERDFMPSPKKSLQKTSKNTHSAKKLPQSDFSKQSERKSYTHLQPKQEIGKSSRVSYLKQKLKQFEKVNQKYDSTTTIKPPQSPKSQNTNLVQKMKNYREYLQQSQSQLDQSNINYRS